MLQGSIKATLSLQIFSFLGERKTALWNHFAPFMQRGANASLQKCDASGDDAERKEANSFLVSLKRRSLIVIEIKANGLEKNKGKETLKSV